MAATAEPARRPRLLLAGPTASGKSALALLLAERHHGAIVSVDSMQVYRGMDIGTAKPTRTERETVPHYLLDVAEPDETFDAARFLALATAAEQEIRSHGRWPIFCGGTGLYFKGLLEGLGANPPSDPALRAALEQLPLEALLAELETADPETWHRIDRKNPRRVVRAVEILRLTGGQPLTPRRAPWQDGSQPPADAEPVHVLRRAPDDLRQRIECRVDAMFAAGLLDETRRLFGAGTTGAATGEDARTARQAIGYRQVLEHLAGQRSLDETVALIKTRTWQFARRQMTWFRGQLPARWVDVDATESTANLAARLERELGLTGGSEEAGGTGPA